MNEQYPSAFSEVICIIDRASDYEKNKIPKSFMNFLIENSNPNYNPQFDNNVEIKDLNLMKETKGILSLIYLSYLSNDEEKTKYKQLLNENYKLKEEELRQKYDVFKDVNKNNNTPDLQDKTDQIDTKDMSMVQYKKENIFKKIFNKIIQIFNRKRR